MRRGVLLILVAGVAALAAGGLALTASGQEDTRAPRAAAPKPAAELPPLPKMRPKVVEPVAGAAGGATQAPVTDPGLTDVGPKPDAAASAGVRRGRSPGKTDITRATAMANGIALPPLEAPEEVKQIIEAGNIIARSPYLWGGGHGKWIDKGYDCSGSVSFALANAGLIEGPMASGPLMSWGKPGRGKWVTVWSSQGHVFMEVAGIRFDTSGQRIDGSRWQNSMRSTSGFVARHPEGL
jgi:cell wall-associated NlpC family hydrolase